MADTPLKVVEGTALTAEQKKDLLHRLARVEGQLRGIQKLIAAAAAPADCNGIAQQMAAARKAMDRSFVSLLTSSMVTHTAGATNTKGAQEVSQRLAAMLDKFA